MNTNFRVTGLTWLIIKPKSTVPGADALTTRPSELSNCKRSPWPNLVKPALINAAVFGDRNQFQVGLNTTKCEHIQRWGLSQANQCVSSINTIFCFASKQTKKRSYIKRHRTTSTWRLRQFLTYFNHLILISTNCAAGTKSVTCYLKKSSHFNCLTATFHLVQPKIAISFWSSDLSWWSYCV